MGKKLKKAVKAVAGATVGGAILAAYVNRNLEASRIQYDANPAKFVPPDFKTINAVMKVFSGRLPNMMWDDEL